MKIMNPKLVGLLLFFGLILYAHYSVNAQHLLEYKSGQKRVIKVIKEQGGALYFQNWPDTTSRSVKAVLLSDVKSLTLLEYSEVDSVYARLTVENEKQQQKNVEEVLARKKMWKENIGLVVMEVDASITTATTRLDYGGGFACGVKRKNGLSILAKTGLDKTNQGQGFIETIQIPIALQVNYDMTSKIMKVGTPFLQTVGGYNYVVSGKYDASRDRMKRYVEYADDQLEGNMFVSIGGGFVFKNKIRYGIFYRLQGSNVKYPEIGYMNFVMVKLSMIL